MRLKSDTASMYPDEEDIEDAEEYDYNPRMEKITTILTILAGVVICIIIILLATKIFGNMNQESEEPEGPIVSAEETEKEYVSMPDVKGVNVDDARNMLINLGLLAEVTYEKDILFKNTYTPEPTEDPTEEEIAFWTEVWETHRRIVSPGTKPRSRNQIVKWIKNPHSDAAEYKMWGNGVSLPCVFFVLAGIVLYSQSEGE